jgi:Uma2 family endonuclease
MTVSPVRSVARNNIKPARRGTMRPGSVSFSEFCAMVPDGIKADLLDGVIHMASPDSIDNGRLNIWLARLLGDYVETLDLGEIFISRIAFRLAEHQGPEPDIAFVPKKDLPLHRRGYFEKPPALAVEIVSADSVDWDYLLKRRLYEESGVREYWIIDPEKAEALFLFRQGKRFARGKLRNHIWKSGVLPGLSIDVRWLWMSPRPRVVDILPSLLHRRTK